VLKTTPLVVRPHFRVHAWTCEPDGPGWSPVECPANARLVLVRAGRFRRRSTGGSADFDATLGYLGVPGEEEHFAHPHGGDVCTSVWLSAAAWSQLVGNPRRMRRATVYVDARVELAHRRLLAAGGTDVDYLLAEELVQLFARAVRGAAEHRTPVTDRPAPAERRLVGRARSAIHDDDPAARGLFPLAELLGTSPYRLSRAFPRELGVSLTRYRNRVRVSRALDRLERDESRLATVAAELGFADQAHFTRVVRQQLGQTPAALRCELRRASTGGPKSTDASSVRSRLSV
jgi:AraC-like DNA-binding protein